MYAWSKSKAAASLAVALGAASSALAHGGVFYYTYAGATYQGVTAYNTLDGQVSIQRPWYTYDPIQNSEGATIACNNYGESLPGSGQQTATVKAGTAITAWWNPWGHNVGPMFTYLAQCPGSTCTGVNSTSLKWFKIDQAGLLSGTVGQGFWGSGQMMAQNSSWTTTIPATVPSGNYLIRFETIALHLLPAQHYPECAQITITGGGTLAPTAAQLVTFPGGYKNTDPGLTVDIYSAAAQTQTTYIIPGPPLYGSGSGSSSSSTKPASSSTVAPSTTTKSTTTVVSTTKPATTSTTTKTSSSSAPSTTGTVAQYGQCGGSGYTGPTVCVSPYTCTKANDFYSQCL